MRTASCNGRAAQRQNNSSDSLSINRLCDPFMQPINGIPIPWYDIVSMVLLACLCLYFGLAAGNFSVRARQKLPSFVFNRNICFMLTAAFLLMAFAKLLGWF